MITVENDRVVFAEPTIYIKEPSFLLDYIYAFIRHSRERSVPLKQDEQFFAFVRKTNYVLTHYRRKEAFCKKLNWYIYNEKLDNKEFVTMFNILDDLEIFDHILPELSRAKTVGQDKKNSDILYWHIVKLLEICPNSGVYRWASILHDLGKYYTEKIGDDGGKHYFYHEYVSYLLAKDILFRFGVSPQDKELILSIVRFHMLPLNYQRNPTWSIDAFRRYIEKCGQHSLEIALFAIHDKKSSNNNEEYLRPLYKFHSVVKNLIDSNTAYHEMKVEKVEE